MPRQALRKGRELQSLIDADLLLITNLLKQFGDRFLRLRLLVRANRTAMSSLSSLRTTAPRHGRLAATADKGTTMATNKKDGYFTTQQEPEGAEEVGVAGRLPIGHQERDRRS